MDTLYYRLHKIATNHWKQNLENAQRSVILVTVMTNMPVIKVWVQAALNFVLKMYVWNQQLDRVAELQPKVIEPQDVGSNTHTTMKNSPTWTMSFFPLSDHTVHLFTLKHCFREHISFSYHDSDLLHIVLIKCHHFNYDMSVVNNTSLHSVLLLYWESLQFVCGKCSANNIIFIRFSLVKDTLMIQKCAHICHAFEEKCCISWM